MRKAKNDILGKPGVYAIWCDNGRHYFGSSDNIAKRLQGHRRLLQNGKHFSKQIQEDWDNLGERSFSFSVVCYYFTPQEARYAERVKLEGHLDFALLYNKHLYWSSSKWKNI